MGSTPRWSRATVAARIVQGEILIVYNGHLLRIPQAWLEAHPGGRLALLHFVGRDASDEIEAYHSDQTQALIKKYSIGTVEYNEDGCWQPLVPPVMTGWVRHPDKEGNLKWHKEASTFTSSSQILLVKKDDALLQSAPSISSLDPPPTTLSLATQTQHSIAYKVLHQRIVEAGLYKTRYITGYGPEILRYCLLGSLSAFTFRNGWFMTSAVFLGLTWHQLVFSAHDLGHMGVTHNWNIDRLLGILIGDFIGGLSIGWWVENHNVHHLVTNHPSHDPDIEHLPFLAISPFFFLSLHSSFYRRILYFDRFSTIFISLQHKLFYIVMLFARFNLYANSYSFLARQAFDIKKARGGRWAWWLEVIGVAFFWLWFGSLLYACGTWKKALAYLLISHVVTSPLHVQIVLSHFAMSTADLGPAESFPHRQLRTTTDVICPPSLSFLHGGLELQVTHHLFPRLPRHNLREASKLVKEYAKEQGLIYAEFGFVKGNEEVVGILRGIAEQVSIMGKVAEGEAKEMVERLDREWEAGRWKKTI